MPGDGDGTPEIDGGSQRQRPVPDSRPDQAAAAEDLRATGDSIVADAGRLAAIEMDKLALAPDDPKVGRLSDDAVALARRIEHETRVERQLSDELR